MADFAKAQLLKYGWREGKGLGKNESGITEALKPKLKFDIAGIGHKIVDSDKWWETAFNNAVKNVNIESHDDGVSLSVIDNDWNTTFSKKESQQQHKKSGYGYFLKTSTLHNGRLVQDASKDLEAKEIAKDPTHVSLTDEQLFELCGRRTMHKAARHACKLSGKLERIEQQNKLLLGASTSSMVRLNTQVEEVIADHKTDKESNIAGDKCKINTNAIVSTIALQSETKSNSTKSRDSTRKRNSKQISNLVHQLSVCNIKENSTESECTPVNDKKSHRRKKRCKQRKADLSVSRNNIEDNKHNIICQIPFPIDKDKEKKSVKVKGIRNHKSAHVGYSNASDETEESSKQLIFSKKTSKRARRWSMYDKEDDRDGHDGDCATVIQIDVEDINTSLRKKPKISHGKSSIDHLIHTSDKEVSKVNREQNKSSCYKPMDPMKNEVDDIRIGKYLPYGKYSALAYESEIDSLEAKALKTINRLNHKIRKKKERRHLKKKKDELYERLRTATCKAIAKRELENIVKGLTAVNLTETKNSKILSTKTKSTPNHIMPV